jgi:hypothetical protein
MIRGINKKTYFSLDNHIDLEKFKSLHFKICRGFAEARHFAKEGTWMAPGFDPKDCSYKIGWKPIFEALNEYQELDNDHPIKKESIDLYNNIKDHETRNKFTRFLKMAMGAYDPYIYYFLWEEGSWNDRSGPRKLTEEAAYFPEIVDWVENLIKDDIFEHIGRVIFFVCEHDGVPFEHRDLDSKNGIKQIHEYTPHRNEFIHIRANTKKGFYIWDPETQNKYYLNCHAAWWNDQDFHGGEKIIEQSYGLRIDGKFTENFRKKLGIDHLDFY